MVTTTLAVRLTTRVDLATTTFTTMAVGRKDVTRPKPVSTVFAIYGNLLGSVARLGGLPAILRSVVADDAHYGVGGVPQGTG